MKRGCTQSYPLTWFKYFFVSMYICIYLNDINIISFKQEKIDFSCQNYQTLWRMNMNIQVNKNNQEYDFYNLRNRTVHKTLKRTFKKINQNSLLKTNKASSLILNNTDMIFLISDFLNDKNSLNFFNTQKSYVNMIESFPNRYKIKKNILLERMENELKKYDARIYGIVNNIIYIRYKMGNKENDSRVWMDGGKLLVKISFGDQRTFRDDPKVLEAFQNYLEC